jgi:ATP-dependent RNA helicase HelY
VDLDPADESAWVGYAETLLEKRAEAESPYGDIEEYRRLRDAVSAERRHRRNGVSPGEMRGAMAKVKPGTIIRVSKGDVKGPVVVVATAHRKSGVRFTVITKGEEVLQIDAEDLIDPPQAVGSIKLPPNFGPQRKGYRRDVAKRLRTAKIASDKQVIRSNPSGRRPLHHDDLDVARDPDLRLRVEAAARADRLETEIAKLQERVAEKNQSLGQEFDRVLTLLDEWGYADVAAWELTEHGEMLASIFNETDLLVAEMLRDGLLDDLSPADLAGIVSCVVYEHRSPDDPPAPWFSSPEVRSRWIRLAAISEELRSAERRLGLGEHRAPDPTFVAIAHAWVSGEGFAEIVDEEELTGGDFVRTMKMLVDLLRQVAKVAPSSSVRSAASRAVDAAVRGVVADGLASG